MQRDCTKTAGRLELIRGNEEPRTYGLRTQPSGYHEGKRGQVMIKVDTIGQEYCLPCSNEIDGVIVERGGVCVICNVEREGK